MNNRIVYLLVIIILMASPLSVLATGLVCTSSEGPDLRKKQSADG